VRPILGPEIPPAVVFVTAYDAYAVRAFEAEALDYVVKPFGDARFERAVERAKDRIARAARQPLPPAAFAVKSAGRLDIVSIADIDWIEGADYYARLHASTRTHLLRRSMAELERDLDAAVFYRIHRSAIVRIERVSCIKTNAAGGYEVSLINGTALPLSRRYRQVVQAALSERGAGEPASLGRTVPRRRS
jgi:two-component system LytT family response regulator